MTYRPLPEGLTIQESTIDGLGLFTLRPIEKDTSLGVARYVIYARDTSEPFQVRTPLGGFVNHSDDPNCAMARSFSPRYGATTSLVTLRDVSPGDELTVSYSLEEYEGAPWR